ncbi:hypothetical protein [Lancefieldella rimae]|uniref:hypothetical protein n=1 Tax=Lancefieldella rimae TaxID=1383 RepID=UPI0028ED2D52|nr:hypothetical protein [Lancefieldella rimae]
METLNILLSIVASLLSIFATVRAYKSKREIERLRDIYEYNTQKAYGNGNSQIVGSGNQVVGHGKQ